MLPTFIKILLLKKNIRSLRPPLSPVSYTHLDVYKRQLEDTAFSTLHETLEVFFSIYIQLGLVSCGEINLDDSKIT